MILTNSAAFDGPSVLRSLGSCPGVSEEVQLLELAVLAAGRARGQASPSSQEPTTHPSYPA